jgi:hypothetical protein
MFRSPKLNAERVSSKQWGVGGVKLGTRPNSMTLAEGSQIGWRRREKSLEVLGMGLGVLGDLE